MAKDYSGWGGRKKRLQDLAAKKEAAQKVDKQPSSKKAKRGKPPTVKHRLDKAEVMICDMARELAHALNLLTELHPDVVVPYNSRKDYWWSKFHFHQAEQLLIDAEEVIEAVMKDADVQK